MYNLKNISSLKSVVKNLKIYFDPEFIVRQEFIDIKNNYNIDLPKNIMDQSLIYFSLLSNNIDLSDGFSTDSRIKKYNLHILKDDKNIFPSYAAYPIINENALKKFYNIKKILKKLENKITQEKIIQLNYEADEKGKNVYDIAYDFLKDEKLIL